MQSEAGSSILKLLRVTAACAGILSFALLYASWRFHRIYEGGILLTKIDEEIGRQNEFTTRPAKG